MKQLLLFFFLLGSLTAFSQGTVTGKLVDTDLGGPLSGANVIEPGTTNGAITDFDGNFSLQVSSNAGTIEISYIGYNTSSIAYTLTGGTANLGSVTLTADADALAEIVIIGSGVIDLAEGRRTPVAVSTVRAQEIQAKVAGNREFTEALKNTPSVYVANQSGGFGDSQIFLRGFDDSNTAFLLNGQPINSVEDGRMFWSNWSGMSDVANAVQVQRGLGSSKLAISSVGGTVNIISKTTNRSEGGFVRFLTGNDSYFKGTASYDSGLGESGWAYSVLVDYWQAHRKYSIGTAGQGQTYLFSVGYKPNDKHAFNFLLTGAPQWHDQNFSDSLEDYDMYGEKQNANSGFLDGKRYTERRNYYHKPVANLNWDFEMNDKMDLSTVLYASWGRGGGTGGLGRGRVRLDDGIDFEQIRTNNIASADANGNGNFGDSYIRRASVNNHNWYGLLSSLNIESGENWNFNVGIDGRLYKGDHWRQVNDLLGLNGFIDNFRTDRPDDYTFTTEFEADPWSALFDIADESERTQFDYTETINNIGGFGQAEYGTDSFSVFVQAAVSSQSLQREGRFIGSEIDGIDGLGKSKKLNKTGYNVKGGASYNIDDNHSIFGNAGYYSRQPYLDNVFVDRRNSNAIVSPEIENEKITGFEGGYRFSNSNLRVNVDIYRTKWANRFLSFSGPEQGGDVESNRGGGGQTSTYRLTDITQVHRGVEMDMEFRPDNAIWRLRGFVSLGNWKYDGESPLTWQNDDTGEFLTAPPTLDLTGTKVGNAPQTSFGAGVVINVCEALSFDADYNVYTDTYGFVDPEDVAQFRLDGGGTFQAERLPAYSLLDAGVTYKFTFGGQKITFRGNVYNATNEAYINQKGSFGYNLGVGRTWNASVRYSF